MKRPREFNWPEVLACLYAVTSAFVTPWAVTLEAPLCKGLSRQAHWRELPFPSPGDLPHPGMEPATPVSPALAGGFSPLSHLGSLKSSKVLLQKIT